MKAYAYDSSHEVMKRYKPPQSPIDRVVTDQLPGIMESSPSYIDFRRDIMTLVGKAERKSGIQSTYGVFVMDLVTQAHCGVNQDLTRWDPESRHREGWFNSASVIKLYQGYILCDMMRMGELSSEKVYHDTVTGRRFRLPSMLAAMISYSDNNYSNATLRLVGNHQSNQVLDRLGLKDSRIYGEMSGAAGYSRTNNLKRYGTDRRCARITPRDAGLILYNVYNHKDTDVYMNILNKALAGNIYNTRIPVGVHKVNAKYGVAHKTGTNSELGVYNDAGIVYCKNPYILVAFTQSTSGYAGEAFIRYLSRDLTLYFDKKSSR